MSILAIGFVYGQIAVKKSCISTSGGSYTNGNTTVTYAVGEVAVQENTQGNIHISEGFIGPDLLVATGIEDYGELYGINAFPNPVKDHLQIELPDEQNYEISLFDLSGKDLKNIFIEQSEYQLQMSHLPSGMYLLVVIDRINKQAKIIKIQKL